MRNLLASTYLLLTLVSVTSVGAQQQRPAWDPVATDPVAIDAQAPAALRPVQIESSGSRMFGVLYLAQGAGPHPTAILLHGFPGNERNTDLAQALRRAGWNVLLFQYRGAWGSEGKFSFGGAIADARAAIDFLSATAADNRVDMRSVVLIGHSFGGFVALNEAVADPRVAGVVFIAGASFPAGMNAATAEVAAAAIDAARGGITTTTGRELVAEVIAHADEWDLTRVAAKLSDRPILFVAGTRDQTVPIDTNHRPIFAAFQRAGNQEVTEVILDADHAFSDKRIALIRAVVGWADRTFPRP